MKNKIRILHIDDNLHDRQLVKDAIMKEPDAFELIESDSRQKFEQHLSEGDFDLILSDFNILGFDGLQVLQLVKEKKPDTPVIIVTGTGSEEIAVQAMKLGAADYVIKSVRHIQNLIPTINNMMEKKKVQDEYNRTLLELRESEERFRLLFENSMDAVLLTIPGGPILKANSVACTMFRMTEQELLKRGRNLADLDDPRLLLAAKERALTGKFRGELIGLHKDGSSFPIEVSSTIFQDSSGNTRSSMIIRDLTERKQAEEALRVSEELFRNVFEHAAVGKSITELNGRIRPNKAFLKILGYPEDDLSVINWQEITHPDDIEMNQKIVDSIISGEYTSKRLEKRYIHLDGHTIWADISTVLLRDNKRKPLYFITTIQDITERKQAEESLRESENRYQTLAEISPVGIFRTDAEGSTTYVNPRWCQISGMSSKDALGNGWLVSVHPDDREKLFNRWKTATQAHTYSTTEYRFIHPDGSIAWVMGYAVPEKNSENQIIGYVGTITDITDRMLAEAEIKKLNESLEQRVAERTSQLQAVNKELEAFSYSVSHDLRAPLRSINGFTQILMEDFANNIDDEGKRLCSVIQNSSIKMGQLIDDLLAFSRVSRIELQQTDIHMKKLVTSIYYEITDLNTQERIQLDIGEICDAKADPNLIKQVWVNLLSNAIKYSTKREKAIISVTSRLEDGKCIYCVKDNGVGFNMEYADKLFRVFQRLHRPKDFEGTGIGLAIVQRIIVRHGGEVWAEAEVDKGASFYFSLTAG
jgi:PAS domain S-box-containing protein